MPNFQSQAFYMCINDLSRYDYQNFYPLQNLP